MLLNRILFVIATVIFSACLAYIADLMQPGFIAYTLDAWMVGGYIPGLACFYYLRSNLKAQSINGETDAQYWWKKIRFIDVIRVIIIVFIPCILVYTSMRYDDLPWLK